MSQPALRLATLPTEDDLPCDDGEPMETHRHRQQMELLIQSLEPWARARGDTYVGGNVFPYFWLCLRRYLQNFASKRVSAEFSWKQ